MSSATVTAVTGPAQTVTAVTFANVTNLFYDFIRQLVRITFVDGSTRDFDVSANHTTTLTYSAPNFTLTIS